MLWSWLYTYSVFGSQEWAYMLWVDLIKLVRYGQQLTKEFDVLLNAEPMLLHSLQNLICAISFFFFPIVYGLRAYASSELS